MTRGQIFGACVLHGVGTGTRVLSPASRVGLGLVSAAASPLEEPGRLQICGIAESHTAEQLHFFAASPYTL